LHPRLPPPVRPGERHSVPEPRIPAVSAGPTRCRINATMTGLRAALHVGHGSISAAPETRQAPGTLAPRLAQGKRCARSPFPKFARVAPAPGAGVREVKIA